MNVRLTPTSLYECRGGSDRMLRKEIDKTVSQLATKRQFNRRVELNAIARKLKFDLELLRGST